MIAGEAVQVGCFVILHSDLELVVIEDAVIMQVRDKVQVAPHVRARPAVITEDVISYVLHALLKDGESVAAIFGGEGDVIAEPAHERLREAVPKMFDVMLDPLGFLVEAERRRAFQEAAKLAPEHLTRTRRTGAGGMELLDKCRRRVIRAFCGCRDMGHIPPAVSTAETRARSGRWHR